jgi:hypothetical protein
MTRLFCAVQVQREEHDLRFSKIEVKDPIKDMLAINTRFL